MQSVSEQVVKLLNETPNLGAKEIAEKTGAKISRVYYALSYMTKTKKIKRRNGKYSIAYELPMTTMPVSIDVPETSPTIRKLQDQLRALQDDYHHLKEEHSENLIAFYDAKAVIKYLEQKLIDVLGKK